MTQDLRSVHTPSGSVAVIDEAAAVGAIERLKDRLPQSAEQRRKTNDVMDTIRERLGQESGSGKDVARAKDKAPAPARPAPLAQDDAAYVQQLVASWTQPAPETRQAFQVLDSHVRNMEQVVGQAQAYLNSEEYKALSRLKPQVAQQRLASANASAAQAQQIIRGANAKWQEYRHWEASRNGERWAEVLDLIPIWRNDAVYQKEIAAFVPWLRERGVQADALATPEQVHVWHKKWSAIPKDKVRNSGNIRLRNPDGSFKKPRASKPIRASKLEQAKKALTKAGVRV